MKISARRHTTNHAARLSETSICNIRGSTTAAGACITGTARSVPVSENLLDSLRLWRPLAEQTLHLENYKLMTAKGFFSVEFAALRADRARQATREACIKLHAAIGQAALEHRLYDRCLKLNSRAAA